MKLIYEASGRSIVRVVVSCSILGSRQLLWLMLNIIDFVP